MASANSSRQPTVDEALLLLDVHRPTIRTDIKQEAAKLLHVYIPDFDHNDQDLVLAAHALLATSQSPRSQYFPPGMSAANSKTTRTYSKKRTQPSSSGSSSYEKSPEKVRKPRQSEKKKERRHFQLPPDGIRKCNYCFATSTPMWRHGDAHI